ncbi:MAG: peptidyl-prolyl cis-trans isomerase [Oscillatoriales cyanobacterium RM2_1_1]|nr:peptidyl-prolyl cis-trans isomerase [Oscillatoriales cyanobacterium SM2_3_0]NJO47602.1 peptidyl-prolyl cis-trans isomerase [Oscillatoriales cyanobacterium RM2_1_1]
MQETVPKNLNNPPDAPEDSSPNDAIQPHWFIRVLREPLIHFLVLGALLFGLYFWVNGSFLNSSLKPASDQIELSAGVLEMLKSNWRRQWGSNPPPEELQAAIDQYIREEVLYREALKLGMDQNDLIIRRRLVQKMEFLAEDLDTLPEPTDQELQSYLAAHPESYAIPSRFSFSQIYFSRELRGSEADADARKLLSQLQAQPEKVHPRELGDRTMLPTQFTRQSPSEITGLLGSTFAREISPVTTLGWQGPFHSVYGTHLIQATEILSGHPATLAEVRHDVRLDWLRAERSQRNQKFYQQLRDRYTVKIDPEALAEPMAKNSAPSEAH